MHLGRRPSNRNRLDSDCFGSSKTRLLDILKYRNMGRDQKKIEQGGDDSYLPERIKGVNPN